MASSIAKGQDFVQHIIANAIVVQPADSDPGASDDVPVLANYETVRTSDKPHRRGLLVDEIRTDLYEITGGWPKRVGEQLFAEGPNHQPQYLDSATRLFGWLDERCHVDWTKGSDCVTQERFFENLQMTAEAYDAVETTPHFPPLPSTYYMHPPLPVTNGNYLDQLVSFFAPLTHLDRELIRSLIVTMCWGGPPGARPIYLITGPDHDPDPNKKGRGVGKSALVAVLSELVGGLMTFSHRDNMETIKTRLLSRRALPLRVALLDNLKTLRFSWDALEALVTSPIISGRQLYEGEGRRPNTLVWVVTLNGATLSKDMAQRAIIIKLKRPEYKPLWRQEVASFIREHRWEILSDIRLCISPPIS